MKNIVHLNRILALSFSLLSIPAFSQLPSSPTAPVTMPSVIPPSPTVANLMHFEEVPVDHYTGQPDISIPLFSKALNSELSLPVVLKYNTMGARVSERSGWTGTGWSLDVGGVVSRTVRGIPDETMPVNTNGNTQGVLHTSEFWNYATLDQNAQGEFLWNAIGTKDIKYDTQPDLYQFSLLGMTGRFVIVKEGGLIVAKPLTMDHKYKIELSYNQTTYEMWGFTIIDANGYRYLFGRDESAIEVTTSNPITSTQPRGGGPSAPVPNILDPIVSRSAWHLQAIELNNKNSQGNHIRLATFTYQPAPESYNTLTSSTSYHINHPLGEMEHNDYNKSHFKPLNVHTYYEITVQTKKLSTVTFPDSSRFEFILSSSVHPENNGKSLERVDYFNPGNALIQSYSMIYETTAGRLWLNDVSSLPVRQSYHFEYFEKEDLPEFGHGDPWGYNNGDFRATMDVCGYNCYDFDAVKRGQLIKITYPTGGIKEFNWESNTFSYEGASLIGDYDSNPNNSENQELSFQFSVDTELGATAPHQITLTHGQYIYVSKSITSGGSNQQYFGVRFSKSGSEDITVALSSINKLVFLSAGTYDVRVGPYIGTSLGDSFVTTGYINIDYTSRVTGASYQGWLLGGGVRISSISFLEPQDTEDPVKRTTGYVYNMLDPNWDPPRNSNPYVSSGSIDSKIGKLYKAYTYPDQKYMFSFEGEYNPGQYLPRNLFYEITTREPNSLLVKGNYVGYKKVTVIDGYQLLGTTPNGANGTTEYTFTNAIDHPMPGAFFDYPYNTPPSIEHKRGNLLKKAVYNKQRQLLEETTYSYNYIQENVGHFIDVNEKSCLWRQFYETFDQYIAQDPHDPYIPTCQAGAGEYPCITSYSNCSYNGFANYAYSLMTTGRTELTGSTHKQYFYTGTTPYVVESSSAYSYNQANYQIAQKTDTITEGASTVTYKTEYVYPVGNAFPAEIPSDEVAVLNSMAGVHMISEPALVKTYRNAELLQTVRNKYKEFATGQYLLHKVFTLKGGLPASELPVERIVYENYNALGNVTDVYMPDGAKTKYLWAYNGTLPVAKVAYPYSGFISPTLITPVESATPANLESALNTFRSNAALNDAHITSLLYDNNLHVRAVKDPRGHELTYEHDNLGRLLTIKDGNNKLASYTYHYRTQSPPEGAPSTLHNFVKTTTFRKEGNDLNTAQQDITYFDGLGRPIQQISGKASSTGKDIITHFEYDILGRQPKEYLPYEGAGSGLAYEDQAQANTLTFYNTPYYENTPNPYSEKFFEESPLNRVLKQAAPGAAWQGSATSDSDRAVKFVYHTNVGDNVKKLRAVATWNTTNKLYNIAFYDDGTYPDSQLYKTVIKDENWVSGNNNTTVEFKNQQGQVVLKRAYNAGTALDTYYVYDQYGNLTYVLPPKSNGSSTYLTTLGYQYWYDARNRLVEKQLPGKAKEYIVYDKLDRVIATGPALRPFGDGGSWGWMYNVYEPYNRVAFAGWYSGAVTSGTRVTLQNANNGSVSNATAATTTNGIDNISIYYKPPATVPAGLKLLTVNYYDDYRFLNSSQQPGSSTQIEGQPVTLNVKSLPTGGWVRALTTASETFGETSYTYYDSKARPVRTNSLNYLGGYTQTDSKLDFDGTTEYTITKHKRVSGDTELVTRDDFTYTAQDRLLKHLHTINALPAQLMSINTYDKLGQLQSKRTGGPDMSPGYQKIDYTYNIRGWLKGINDVDNLSGNIGSFSDLFAFRINYNEAIAQNINGNVTPLYNGNIAETSWRTANDNVLRRYGYKYDNLNRLTNAYYQKPNNAVPVTNSYNEAITYDANGNIMSLQRNGDLDDATTTLPIDNLVYTYDTGSNLLNKVADSTNSPKGFKDSPDNNTPDYLYDQLGNMNYDRNKGIESITYNHLNLPVVIYLNDTGTKKITYIYDATGVKLKKTVTDGTAITEVDYLAGGYQYKNGVLSFFPTAEGYVDHTIGPALIGSVYNYVYQYKDHLGNVRLSYVYVPGTKGGFPASLAIKEESNYYPFGLKHTAYNSNTYEYGVDISGNVTLMFPVQANKLPHNYKYQGQERQDELGLNWDSFKWRNYDYAIGRFMSIDPLAEVYEWQSVYAFASNQPVHAKELEGMESENDVSGNNRSWSFSRFLEGAGEAIQEMGISSALGPLDLRNDYHTLKNLVNGDFEGAAKSTTIYQMGKTVVDAVNGDEKAQGAVTVTVVTALVTKKAAGRSAVKTSATASSEASKASAARSGGKSHGNAKANQNSQHLYEITNDTKGTRHKVGVSGGKLNNNGTSRRANSQVKKLNKQGGDTYSSQVKVKNVKGRENILKIEQKEVDLEYQRTGTTAPGQKRPKPTGT